MASIGGKSTALDGFVAAANTSWLNQLDPDPETARHSPNRTQRPVLAGHYVLATPTPLPNPKLVIVSKSMAKSLNLSEDAIKSSTFLRFFSADTGLIPQFKSWATPYALSQGGHEVYRNCPYGNGTGYGDGRASSIAEVKIPGGGRWELQLKGSGPTPFCRGADGRAVLRSSVREFLASEAMHALGVPTTRALCLIVSKTGKVRRPWYSEELRSATLDREDPKLKQFSRKMARQLHISNPAVMVDVMISLLLNKPHPMLKSFPEHIGDALKSSFKQFSSQPDVMQEEAMAITTRIAPSFLRVGHMDLHARRTRPGIARDGWEKGDAEAKEAVEKMVKHALFREFADVDKPDAELGVRALLMVREAAQRFSALIAGWLRVGFCQGNFNADNCLVAGRTMDYGPFGFIEKYEPLWNIWSGGGDSYAFMNQISAAAGNFRSFVRSICPVLSPVQEKEAMAVAAAFKGTAQKVANDMWRQKLGLPDTDPGREASLSIWAKVENLMKRSNTDWTIFWRQLAELPPLFATTEVGELSKLAADDLLKPLQAAFYAPPLSASLKKEWAAVLRQCVSAGATEGRSGAAIGAAMKKVNPKYVPREWMLVEAYTAAQKGDYALVHALHALFEHPYDEGTPAQAAKYYQKAPASAATTGGTGFMT